MNEHPSIRLFLNEVLRGGSEELWYKQRYAQKENDVIDVYFEWPEKKSRRSIQLQQDVAYMPCRILGEQNLT